MVNEVLNRNMLSPSGFKFTINRTPNLNFFIQSVTLPGINFSAVDQPTRFKNIPVPSNKITYSELDVAFKVDEDLNNYQEIFDWITGLGFPDNHRQYQDIKNTQDGIYSDANLVILSSSRNGNVVIDIQDLFPISLSPLEMNVRDTSVEYVEATASFQFMNYTFRKI